MDEKMKVVEDAVRQYIRYGIAIFEKDMPRSKDYTVHCKWYGYIRGAYEAFVITDDPNDNSIYEVTFDPHEDDNYDKVTMSTVHVRRYLAMGDREFNIQIATSENDRHASRTSSRHIKETPIRIVETGEIFKSQGECARAIGGSQANIYKCLKGERHTCKGYHFEYVEES